MGSNSILESVCTTTKVPIFQSRVFIPSSAIIIFPGIKLCVISNLAQNISSCSAWLMGTSRRLLKFSQGSSVPPYQLFCLIASQLSRIGVLKNRNRLTPSLIIEGLEVYYTFWNVLGSQCNMIQLILFETVSTISYLLLALGPTYDYWRWRASTWGANSQHYGFFCSYHWRNAMKMNISRQ